MAHIFRSLITFLFSFICLHAFGQGVLDPPSESQSTFPQFAPNVIPASPDAFSFTRYGNLPIGLSTGTAQFALPVYNIQSGNLKHSISINYSSNGVRVDEMATRVGINWNLRVGGVITRTIMDLPDDAPGVQRTFYHGLFGTGDTSASWPFYNYIKQASYAGRPDFQPDEYSFSVDGYAGKFIKRENGNFTQFNYSGVKIEQNSNGFLLTAPDGTKYYFYLVETARNFSYPVNTAFEWIPTAMPTSWYLTKIVSPTQDSIVFNYTSFVEPNEEYITYKNGISQDLATPTVGGLYLYTGEYLQGSRGNSAPELPILALSRGAPGETTLVQLTNTLSAAIVSIQFSTGTIEFIYSDRDDIPYDQKLDSIKVIRKGDNKLIKCFALEHTYSYAAASSYDTYFIPAGNYTNSNPDLRKRLFLTKFKEVSSDLAHSQQFTFEYDDFNGLPPRLSFAQDRYGYFNGKANSKFYPGDTWFEKHLAYRSMGGNRDYSFSYAKKGLLQKIIYPTGGYSILDYEPNKIEGDYAFKRFQDSITAIIDTSTYGGQEIYSDTFYHGGYSGLKTLIMKGYCEWASVPADLSMDFEEEYRVSFLLIDINTGLPASLGGGLVQVGDTFMLSDFLSENLPAGTYKIKLIANRPHLRAKIVAERHWKLADHSDTAGIAGVRVKSIADYSSDWHETNRREFVYENWDSTATSTGTGLLTDVNNGKEVSFTRTIDQGYYTGYNTIHSNSILANYLTDNNTVLYKKVFELNHTGGGVNNGGTEYQFYYDAKTQPIPASFSWGPDVWNAIPYVPAGASFSNPDLRTGSLQKTRVFSYAQKFGSRSILSESENYYSLDSSTMIVDSFTTSRHVLKRDGGGAPEWQYFYDYDIYRYLRYFGFLKLDSAIQKSYAGSQTLTNKTSYSYTNANYKVAQENHYLSDGSVRYVNYRYPPNITSSETDYTDYYNMTLQNIIDPPIYQATSKNASTNAQQTYYNLFTVGGNSFYLPSTTNSKFNSNAEITELTVEQYDANGRILQYKTRDGITNSIVWGYGNNYPVAKVQGETYNNSIAVLDTSILNHPASDYAMRTELNKLRTQLGSGVFTSTLTYSPLIGLTSQTDVNNHSVYYEYDNFNRLKLIRDQDSSIVKKFCYNYKGEETECAENPTFPPEPCSSLTNCQGYNKMCIYGNCVTSTEKILAASVEVSTNSWECTYYYRFYYGLTYMDGTEFVEYAGVLGCLGSW